MMPHSLSLPCSEQRRTGFSGFILYSVANKRRLAEGVTYSRGECLALEFTLQKSSLRRCWESTAGIAGIPQCPFTPLRRCLITSGLFSTFGTHTSCERGCWRWEEKPLWCWRSRFSVLNSDTSSSGSWWACSWGMGIDLLENTWLFFNCSNF